MPSIDDVFSDYLKASSLQGKEPTVTIESVEVKKMPDGTKKLDIGFVGKEKHLLANKTNCTRIAFLHGNDYDEWVGKKIQLYPASKLMLKVVSPCNQKIHTFLG